MVHVSMYRLLCFAPVEFCSKTPTSPLFGSLAARRRALSPRLTHCSCGAQGFALALLRRHGTAYAHSHLLIATACELRTPMHSSAFAKRSSAKLI